MKGIFTYHLWISLGRLFFEILCSAVCIGIFRYFMHEGSMMSLNIIFYIYYLTLSCNIGNSSDREKYMTFCYCRKKYFRHMAAIALIRAAVLGCLMAVEKTLLYEKYLREFAKESGDNIILYHRVPIGFLFFIFFASFAFIELVFLWDSTHKNCIFGWWDVQMNGERAKGYGKDGQRKKGRIRQWAIHIGRVLGFVFLIIWGVSIPSLYSVYLQSSYGTWLLACGGYALLAILFFFLAKRRHQPKYI